MLLTILLSYYVYHLVMGGGAWGVVGCGRKLREPNPQELNEAKVSRWQDMIAFVDLDTQLFTHT